MYHNILINTLYDTFFVNNYLDEMLDFTELFETISENFFLELQLKVMFSSSSDTSDELSPEKDIDV